MYEAAGRYHSPIVYISDAGKQIRWWIVGDPEVFMTAV